MKLSIQAKAEILANVLHSVECVQDHPSNVLSDEDRWLINRAQRDCSISIEGLTKEDIQNVAAWFKLRRQGWKDHKKERGL